MEAREPDQLEETRPGHDRDTIYLLVIMRQVIKNAVSTQCRRVKVENTLLMPGYCTNIFWLYHNCIFLVCLVGWHLDGTTWSAEIEVGDIQIIPYCPASCLHQTSHFCPHSPLVSLTGIYPVHVEPSLFMLLALQQLLVSLTCSHYPLKYIPEKVYAVPTPLRPASHNECCTPSGNDYF